MKSWIALLTLFLISAQAQEWVGTYAELLDKYVTPTGVRYQPWTLSPRDSAKLDSALVSLAKTPLPASGNARKAYLINAYNLGMLSIVLQQYPLGSVKDIAPSFGVFKQKRLILGGQKFSLDDIEKNLLLKEFPDARIHFAVNCASRSCPPIAPKPYRAEMLEVQLDASVKAALDSNPLAIQFDPAAKTANLSSLFDWYAPDFQRDGGGTALGFINRYKSSPLPASVKIKFQPYDWSLNEAK
jgi:hypothetical protein